MAPANRPEQFMHRILLVEDDFALADLLFEVLTFENCTVDRVSNGMEALDLLGSGTYDAIISDLMMPRMSGEALYREVERSYPFLADKFLFISSQSTVRGGMGDFIQGTGNTLLEKPFEMEQFHEALRELLERS
jgi:DNA-binding response OmpR family regulator